MKPVYHLALDSEDDGEGHPTLFCAVHQKGAFHRKTAASMREELYVLSRFLRRDGQRLMVWCHNLEYDLVNLIGLERLRDCKIFYGRLSLVKMIWRGIEFRDTLRHLTMSLEEVGAELGMPKLKRDHSLRYCYQDARIVFGAVKLFRRFYRRLKIEPGVTMPATALRVWSRMFGRVEECDPEVVDRGHTAYYGARTECLIEGTRREVKVIDVASMYPWAMTAGPFPVPWGAYRRVGRGAEIQPLGLYSAGIRSSVLPGPLPVRHELGLVFPVGRWSGWYVGEELLHARDVGAEVQVYQGIEFHHEVRPFDRYVRRLFKLKRDSDGATRTMAKLMLNSLYGKFGQGGERTRIVSLREYKAMRSPPWPAIIWNGIVIWTEEGRPPVFANQVWAAIVTARARVKLHRMMLELEAAGAEPIYCDTDSIFFTSPWDRQHSPTNELRFPDKAQRPGEFELRRVYRRVEVVGRKEYLAEGRNGEKLMAVKGVPEDQRENYLRTGRASFSLPSRIRSAIRSGEVPNVWRTVDKQRHRSRRRAGPDGRLEPIEVGLNEKD